MTPTTSALPSEIERVITRVVSRTRLRRAERADIERELRAHFLDGLASGRDEAELLQHFGDPVTAAKALRSGALAKRSRFDRLFHSLISATLWGGGALATLYAIAALYLRANPPIISFDAHAAFLATMPDAPEGERAWPLYKRGLVALADPVPMPDSIGGRPGSNEAVTGRELKFHSLGVNEGAALPGDASWEDQRQVFLARRDGIDQIVAGSRMKALGFRPGFALNADDAYVFAVPSGRVESRTETQTLFSLLLPHLACLRTAAMLVSTDSLIAVEEGHGPRFVDDVEAMLRIADHAEEGKLLISQLVGSAIRTLAVQRVIMAIEWRPEALSDADLDALARSLESIPATAFEADLSTEALALRDFVQRTYSDDGEGDGYFNASHGGHYLAAISVLDDGNVIYGATANALASPLSAFAFASRKETLDLIDTLFRQCEEESRRPIHLQDHAYDVEVEQLHYASALTKIKWTIPRLLVPAVSKVAHSRQLGRAQRDAALVVIAMERHRRSHSGAWPAALSDLAPETIAELPVDPYDGAPLRYRVLEGTPTIWSVGPNKIDDGGAADPSKDLVKYPRLGWVRYPDDADWIWFAGDDRLARWRRPP